MALDLNHWRMSSPILAAVLALQVVSGCRSLPDFQSSYAKAVQPDLALAERETNFKQALRFCSADVPLHREYVSFLISNKNFAEALRWIDKALKLAPVDPELHIKQAASLLGLGRARETLESLKTVSPSGESYLYQGMAQRLLQDHAAARKSFRAAWQLGNKDPYVLYSLIQEDYALADKTAGLRDFQTMLERFPNSAWVHELLGDAYFAKDKDEDAAKEYQQALALKGDLLSVNFRLGYLAFQNGSMNAAAEYFRKEIKLNPSYVDARVFLAEALAQLDQRQEAINQLKAALALEQSELIYQRLAAALIQTNRLPEAAEMLHQAELRFPENPAFPAQLSRLLMSLNRVKDAKDEAARAQRLTIAQHQKQEIAPIR